MKVYLGFTTSEPGRVVKWLSPKYWTTQNIELFTHALSDITIIFIPDKEPKCVNAFI